MEAKAASTDERLVGASPYRRAASSLREGFATTRARPRSAPSVGRHERRGRKAVLVDSDDDGERHLVGLLFHAVRDAGVRRQAATPQATIPSVSKTLTTLPLESTLALGSTVAPEPSLQASVSFTLFSENELPGEAEAAEFMAQVGGKTAAQHAGGPAFILLYYVV